MFSVNTLVSGFWYKNNTRNIIMLFYVRAAVKSWFVQSLHYSARMHTNVPSTHPFLCTYHPSILMYVPPIHSYVRTTHPFLCTYHPSILHPSLCKFFSRFCGTSFLAMSIRSYYTLSLYKKNEHMHGLITPFLNPICSDLPF